MKEKAFTKSELIKEFAEDQLELNYHAEDEAETMGISVKEYAKRIAIEEFDIRLQEGSIVKVGRRFMVK